MVQERMKSTPQRPPWKTGLMGSKQGFCCVPLAFAFCVHAAKTTEPILALARWSLQFSSIIPCRKAEKHKYFLIFLPPVLLFATGRATVPRSSGQIELCIHAIQFCTPRSKTMCTHRKISICIDIRVHYFHTNKNISSFSLVYKHIRILSMSLIFNCNWNNLDQIVLYYIWHCSKSKGKCFFSSLYSK